MKALSLLPEYFVASTHFEFCTKLKRQSHLTLPFAANFAWAVCCSVSVKQQKRTMENLSSACVASAKQDGFVSATHY